MLDASCAGKYRSPCTFVTMCMNEYRHIVLGRFLNDDAQLSFRVNLLARIGKRQAGALRSASFDHVNTAIDIDLHKPSQIIVRCHTVDEKLTKPRIGQRTRA